MWKKVRGQEEGSEEAKMRAKKAMVWKIGGVKTEKTVGKQLEHLKVSLIHRDQNPAGSPGFLNGVSAQSVHSENKPVLRKCIVSLEWNKKYQWGAGFQSKPQGA